MDNEQWNSLEQSKVTPPLGKVRCFWDAKLKFVRENKKKKKSYWERVLGTDEAKTELLGRNRWNHVWRKDGDAFKPQF